MAIFKSSIYSEIRGSIAGTTYTRNRYGQIARQRVKPTDPKTTPQAEARNRFGQLAMRYRSLSPAQRDLWQQHGTQTLVPNKLGDMVALNGPTFFNFANAVRFEGAMRGWNDGDATPMAIVDDCPGAGYGVGYAYQLQSTFTTPTCKLSLGNIDIQADLHLAVVCRRSPGMPLSINYYNGPWINPVAFEADDNSDLDIYTGLVVSLRYFVQISLYASPTSTATPARRSLSEVVSVVGASVL